MELEKHDKVFLENKGAFASQKFTVVKDVYIISEEDLIELLAKYGDYFYGQTVSLNELGNLQIAKEYLKSITT